MESLAKSVGFGAIAIVAALSLTRAPASAEARLTPQVDYAWDMLCYGDVRPVSKPLKLRRPLGTVEVTDSIKLCNKHLYQYAGKFGQRVHASLSGSTRTWLIIYRKDGARLATGERDWEGTLPKNGKYIFEIVTTERDAAVYKLKLEFR
jgi:hypothetical protein